MLEKCGFHVEHSGVHSEHSFFIAIHLFQQYIFIKVVKVKVVKIGKAKGVTIGNSVLYLIICMVQYLIMCVVQYLIICMVQRAFKGESFADSMKFCRLVATNREKCQADKIKVTEYSLDIVTFF